MLLRINKHPENVSPHENLEFYVVTLFQSAIPFLYIQGVDTEFQAFSERV